MTVFNPTAAAHPQKRDIYMRVFHRGFLHVTFYYHRPYIPIWYYIIIYNIREPGREVSPVKWTRRRTCGPIWQIPICGHHVNNILYIYIYIYVNRAVVDRGPRDLCARILRISRWSPTCRPPQFSRFFDFIITVRCAIRIERPKNFRFKIGYYSHCYVRSDPPMMLVPFFSSTMRSFKTCRFLEFLNTLT